MFLSPSRRFEVLVRMARGLISMVDSMYFALARWQGGSGLVIPQVGTSFALRSGEDELEAWFVSPSAPARAALLILPGIGDRMEYWRQAQAMLARHGIASLVFHYSGYLGSKGHTTPEAMERDAHAAYAALRKTMPPATPMYVLGFSLGSGVVAQVAAELDPAPEGVILCQPYTSFRAAARRVARPAPWLARLAPDLWRSAENLRRLHVPLLIVHAEGDALFPAAMARQLAGQSPAEQPATLALIPRHAHNAIYLSVPEDYWAPILRFVLASPGTTE